MEILESAGRWREGRQRGFDVSVDLVSLAGDTGARPACHVTSDGWPDEPARHQVDGGTDARVGQLVDVPEVDLAERRRDPGARHSCRVVHDQSAAAGQPSVAQLQAVLPGPEARQFLVVLLTGGQGVEVVDGRHRRSQQVDFAGEGVGRDVRLPGDVSHVRRELRHELDVASLTWGVAVTAAGDGVRQRLVIREHDERAPFHRVPEMTDRQIDGQQLPAERAVAPLGFPQGAREEPEGLPGAAGVLLQHRAHADVGGVHLEADGSVSDGVEEQSGVSEGSLAVGEGCLRLLCPGDWRVAARLASTDELVERRQELCCSWDEPVVEVHHPDEAAQLSVRLWQREALDSFHSGWEGCDAL